MMHMGHGLCQGVCVCVHGPKDLTGCEDLMQEGGGRSLSWPRALRPEAQDEV